MKQKETIQQLKSFFNTVKGIDLALLYGSFARGTMSVNSDIDIQFLIDNTLFEENNFISYNLEASEIPKAVGQLSLFAVPVVILFYEGKEFHRQAKIIDFEELEYRIGQISEKY